MKGCFEMIGDKSDCSVGAESPLRVTVENDEVVIRMGVNRFDGNEAHPTLPALVFADRNEWIRDVIRELERDDEMGGTPLIYLLERCMNDALEQGTAGVAEDSPTHIGLCSVCSKGCMPLRHTNDGEVCPDCYYSDARFHRVEDYHGKKDKE